MGHKGRSNADDALAAALAAGKSHRDAAAGAGVSEKTVYRRLRELAFRKRVGELRAAMMAAALGKLTDGMAGAAEALTALVADPSPDVRFKAAKAVVELALRVRDQAELADRLARVEDLLAGEPPDAVPDPDPAQETGSSGRGTREPAGKRTGPVPGGPGPADD